MHLRYIVLLFAATTMFAASPEASHFHFRGIKKDLAGLSREEKAVVQQLAISDPNVMAFVENRPDQFELLIEPSTWGDECLTCKAVKVDIVHHLWLRRSDWTRVRPIEVNLTDKTIRRRVDPLPIVYTSDQAEVDKK